MLSLLGSLGGPSDLFAHASLRVFPAIMLPMFLTADGKLVRDFLLGVLCVLGEGDGSNLFTGLEILVDLRSPEPDDFPDDLPDDLVVNVALGTAGSVISSSPVLV